MNERVAWIIVKDVDLYLTEWMKFNLGFELNRCSIRETLIFYSRKKQKKTPFINWTYSHKSMIDSDLVANFFFERVFDAGSLVFIYQSRNSLNSMLHALYASNEIVQFLEMIELHALIEQTQVCLCNQQ